MRKIQRIITLVLSLAIFTISSVILGMTGAYLYLSPQLPLLDDVRNIQLQIPLRIYSSDQKLIAEFGEKRRDPIGFEEIPKAYIQAATAAEDQIFFEHSGVDLKGLARAVKLLVENRGEIKGGGSTITMQLTKLLFLSSEQSFIRKFKQIILALQLENELSKEEILELYLNLIYLGKGAYGIQAAAQVYYGLDIGELNVAQLAMIAGTTQLPSRYNPINNPERALTRRNWILKRMLILEHIDEETYQESVQEPITAKYHGLVPEVEAPYLAEMIRKELFDTYGKEIYTEGFKAVASIDSNFQKYANEGVYDGLHQYDERHGYRGVLGQVELPEPEEVIEEDLEKPEESETDLASETLLDNAELKIEDLDSEPEEEAIPSLAEQYLGDYQDKGRLKIALVTRVNEEGMELVLKDDSNTFLKNEDLLWAREYIDVNTVGDEIKFASDVFQRGDIVYLRHFNNQWRLAQEPLTQAAFVAVDPDNGAVMALVGGYDYKESKFNRAVQGGRQAGSSFKPFVYTAALENGFTAASIINDAPVVFNDSALESVWRPENSGGKFYGPTRFRQALYRSRNLVSIRILRKIGIGTALDSAERFGFNRESLPNNLSLALGSASLTPLEVANGFNTFANGGYKVEPFFIDELRDINNQLLFKAAPITVCRYCDPDQTEFKPSSNSTEEISEELESETELTNNDFSIEALSDQNTEEANYEGMLPLPDDDNEKAIEENPFLPVAEQIVEPRVNFIMNSILADVVKRGTGRRALALGRSDMKGKTGTTNDQIDAWFTGYNNKIVATAWMGFDDPSTLGRGEYGATAALPIWLSFMKKALVGIPEEIPANPDKLVTIRINGKTGEPAFPGDKDVIFEIFREEFAPKQSTRPSQIETNEEEEIEPDQLF